MSELELVPQAAYAPGTFCWMDLATTDPPAAKRFYSELFGWSVEDVPMGEAGDYSMLRKEGADVGGLYPMDAQQRAQGVTPYWLAYVSVADVEEAIGRARSLGAAVLVEPVDVFTAGRMALLRDPTGAAVALWQAREHRGAGVLNQPGGLCWVELLTPDPERAGAFYTELLGWSTEGMEIGGVPYTVFKRGEESAGGMMRIPAEAGETPAHWSTCLAVESADGSVARAAELGAQVLVPPTDIPGVGRYATLRDPQGATFSILSM